MLDLQCGAACALAAASVAQSGFHTLFAACAVQLLSSQVHSLQAAQGYGALDKVPAFYGLWWHAPGYIRPTFDPVNKLLNKLHTGRPFLTVMRSGFSSLWENIVAKDGLDVQLGCTVTHIDRSKGGKQTIEYTQTTLEIDLDGLVTGKQDERKTIADADLVVVRRPFLFARAP